MFCYVFTFWDNHHNQTGSQELLFRIIHIWGQKGPGGLFGEKNQCPDGTQQQLEAPGPWPPVLPPGRSQHPLSLLLVSSSRTAWEMTQNGMCHPAQPPSGHPSSPASPEKRVKGHRRTEKVRELPKGLNFFLWRLTSDFVSVSWCHRACNVPGVDTVSCVGVDSNTSQTCEGPGDSVPWPSCWMGHWSTDHTGFEQTLTQLSPPEPVTFLQGSCGSLYLTHG